MAAAPTREEMAPITGEYSWEKQYENFDDAKSTLTGRILELKNDITRLEKGEPITRSESQMSEGDYDKLIDDFDKTIDNRDTKKEELYCCNEALKKLEKLFTEEKNIRLSIEESNRDKALLRLNELDSEAKRTGKLGRTEEASKQYYDTLEKIDNIDRIVTETINVSYKKELDFRGFCKKINSEIDDLSKEFEKVEFADVAGVDTSAPTPKKSRGLGRIFGKTRKGGKSRRKYKNKRKTRKGNKKRRVKTRKGKKRRKTRKS